MTHAHGDAACVDEYMAAEAEGRRAPRHPRNFTMELVPSTVFGQASRALGQRTQHHAKIVPLPVMGSPPQYAIGVSIGKADVADEEDEDNANDEGQLRDEILPRDRAKPFKLSHGWVVEPPPPLDPADEKPGPPSNRYGQRSREILAELDTLAPEWVALMAKRARSLLGLESREWHDLALSRLVENRYDHTAEYASYGLNDIRALACANDSTCALCSALVGAHRALHAIELCAPALAEIDDARMPDAAALAVRYVCGVGAMLVELAENLSEDGSHDDAQADPHTPWSPIDPQFPWSRPNRLSAETRLRDHLCIDAYMGLVASEQELEARKAAIETCATDADREALLGKWADLRPSSPMREPLTAADVRKIDPVQDFDADGNYVDVDGKN